MARTGVITRRDIITDQALEFGGVYAKNVEKAIGANKKMVTGAKALHKVFLDINSVQGNSAFNTYLQNTAVLMQQISSAVALQNASLRENQNIVNQLTSTQVTANQARLEQLRIDREVQRLGTTESQRRRSDIALQEAERRQTEAATRAQQRQARETANQASAYVQLQRKRNEAQRTLADLMSAERLNITEIQRAQREFQILDARLRAVDTAVRNYSREVGNYRGALRGLNSTMRELISTFGLATGIALFGMIVKDIFSTIKDFDRQLIAVGKTTNISGEELKQFGREVVALGDKIDGVSVEGLLKSSEVAGQLGVRGTENILKFSTAVEKLKLTSNIISDEQVQNFAKFIEVSSDSFENADRLASVITELGNNFASTEAEVLANATEIQKGTAVYKTSAEGVLALGAATSALGSEAESSRSAIQSTFAILNNAIALNRNLDKVLKITGLSQAQLTKEFGDDATKVFVKFVKGLNTAKNEGQNLSLVLNELGIKEKRAFTVVGSLAANYELLERAMFMASEEYKNNIALNKEVEAASQSVSSILGDIKDKFDAYILSTNDANDGTKSITTALKFLRDNLGAIITALLKYGSVIVSFLLIQKTWNTLVILWTAIQTAANAAQVRFALSTGIGTRAVLAQAAAVREATVAQTGMNVAMSATPWGIILAFIGAAAVAYQVFNDELSDHEMHLQRIKNQNDSMQEAEDYYAKARDENREKSFKEIEDEMKLRKAQGENSVKVDELEIKKKKEVVQSQLDVLENLKKIEFERTQNALNQSAQRIAQYDKELREIERKDNAGGRTTSRNAQRSTLEYYRNEEAKKLEISSSSLQQNAKLTQAEAKKLNQILSDLDKDKAVKAAQFSREESEKARKERERLRKLYISNLKEEEKDDYDLRQFRLKNNSSLNDEILKDDTALLDSKVEALLENQQFDMASSKETLEYKLLMMALEKDGLEKLSAYQFKQYLENSKFEIEQLVKTGELKRELTNKEKKVLEESQAESLAIIAKGEKDKQALIDSEVAKVNSEIERQVNNEERKVNEAIEAENIKFLAVTDLESMNQAQREKAVKEHEERILAIKKKFALDALDIQIKGLEQELADNDAKEEGERISAKEREKIENQLQAAKTEASALALENQNDIVEKRLLTEEEFADRVKEISKELAYALADFANALFEARIANIDNEMQRNEEYYARQIELAGNDAEQKKLLEQEAEAKRQELEKKKRKEQQKQAIFNKALALTEIAIKTAMAIVAALAVGPPQGYIFATLSGALGLAQSAAVAATPIPKYKDGRKGGKAEFAEVGDGYVSEVIKKADGRAYITPNRPTLTYLEKGDSVYSSIADYQRMMRASVMTSLAVQNGKMNDYQASKEFDYNFQILEDKIEKGIAKGFKNARQNITINPAKIDIGHEIWKSKNTRWD